jgi:hypothetical protein
MLLLAVGGILIAGNLRSIAAHPAGGETTVVFENPTAPAQPATESFFPGQSTP